MEIIKIDELGHLGDEPLEYVTKQLEARIQDIAELPSEVKELFVGKKTLLDIGPGEGISSMALAHNFNELSVMGLEMDRKHLVGAWPTCNNYTNLELFFGALPGTPSNQKVDGDSVIPQIRDKQVDILFSWTGISRKDLFNNSLKWNELVEDCCVFIIPKFWREGLEALPEVDELKSLLAKLDSTIEPWDACNIIPGFKEMEVYSLNQSLKARGWILWLSGIFDNVEVSFWNTLTDRWRDKLYQLESIDLPLEIVVVKK